MTTYSDTTPQRRVITDVISLIDPSDAPVVNALGGLDGASGKFRFVNGESTVVEWLEDTLTAISDTMNEGASITSTVTTITVTDGTLYEKGHVIAIESEHCWVSSVSTNTITVTRGSFSSTAATHASTTAISIIGMARLEGAESDGLSYTDRSTNSNWTQIYHQEVKVTRTHQMISQYGITDEMAYQGDKVVPSLMRLVERDLLNNKGGQAGTASTPRKSKGLQAFITTNKLSGASLAQSQFENAVLSCYTAGEMGPFQAYCAPANMQKIKNWYDATTILRVQRTETTVGMKIIRVETPFGDVDLIMTRWAPTTVIPIVAPKHAGFKTFYPFTQKPLAVTGDYERSEVVGEFTFCLRQNAAHALLTAVN
jgi:hypothetical protein